jgi:hypothetical protein
MIPERRIVLVHYHHYVTPQCEDSLRGLERAGVEVRRAAGVSIDYGRSLMASEVVHAGIDALLFIDADIAFQPEDAIRLLDDPEPVLAGVYCRRGGGNIAAAFPDERVSVGAGGGRYRAVGVGAGFLRIRTEVLRRMIDELKLPLCFGEGAPRGLWPFFLPLIAHDPTSGPQYLQEDYAFCHRCHRIGVNVVADTTIRLWHVGTYAYHLEDIGGPREPCVTVNVTFGKKYPTWGFDFGPGRGTS